jgi:hypothetical protein
MSHPALRNRRLPAALAALITLCTASLGGCAPEIGDDCKSSLDCSTNNTRICDTTQPEGYCTIMDCEKGTCPEDSVCVKFVPLQERLVVTYCMAQCEKDKDCREDDGYLCTKSTEFGADTEIAALVLDGDNRSFCSIPEKEVLRPDAGPLMSEDDSGAPEAGPDDAGSAP